MNRESKERKERERSNGMYNLKIEGELKHFNFQGTKDILPIILATMKKNAKEVLVYYDPDIDGVMAGTLARRFVEYILKIPTDYYVNANRGHGFQLEKTEVANKFVVGVDFGITSKEVEELTKQGTTIVVFDHHDCEDDVILYDNGKRLNYYEVKRNPEQLKSLINKQGVGILINNQYPRDPEDLSLPREKGENPASRYLSGAGVVFESVLTFLTNHMPDKVKQWNTQEQRAMVGWTLLSDVRDIESPYAKLYLQELYTYEKNLNGVLTDPYVNVILMLNRIRLILRKKNKYEAVKFGKIYLDRTCMDFSLSPLMNANFRFDRGDDVIQLFWGGYWRDKNKKLTNLASLENFLPIDIEAHQKQKALKKDIETYVEEHNTGHYYGENNSLYVFTIDIADQIKINKTISLEDKEALTNFVGLVCNAKRTKNSVIGCVLENGKLLRASFRGQYQANYKDALMEGGYLEGAGHGGAFGIRSLDLSEENLNNIARVCAEIDKNIPNNKKPVIKVNNMASFCMSRGRDGVSKAYEVAFENMFHLDENKVCLQYTGPDKHVTGDWNAKQTVCRYLVDNREVIAYNYPASPLTTNICPSLEDNKITFTLEDK